MLKNRNTQEIYELNQHSNWTQTHNNQIILLILLKWYLFLNWVVILWFSNRSQVQVISHPIANSSNNKKTITKMRPSISSNFPQKSQKTIQINFHLFKDDYVIFSLFSSLYYIIFSKSHKEMVFSFLVSLDRYLYFRDVSICIWHIESKLRLYVS